MRRSPSPSSRSPAEPSTPGEVPPRNSGRVLPLSPRLDIEHELVAAYPDQQWHRERTAPRGFAVKGQVDRAIPALMSRQERLAQRQAARIERAKQSVPDRQSAAPVRL